MNSISVLGYLEKRQLGYAGPKRVLYDMFIDQFACTSKRHELIDTCNGNIGNTFSCKFSKNKNNLHVIACSTEHGEIIIQNTLTPHHALDFKRCEVHDNAIFNFEWAEPDMSIVTACGDQTAKVCAVNPAGTLDVVRGFNHDSSVKGAMFCPGSSDIICTGSQDGSLKIWDARSPSKHCEINIPSAHATYGPVLRRKKARVFGVSAVIYQDRENIVSCSSMDPFIKIWDLRKSYCHIKGNKEPLAKVKYSVENINVRQNSGYTYIIINKQNSYLYASNINNTIFRYSLGTNETNPICEYSGFTHETGYSKISISYDGRYLFSGCTDHSGVIWLTDFPCIAKPVYKMTNVPLETRHEYSVSDWCADPSCLKLGLSSDSLPVTYSIVSKEHFNRHLDIKMFKTPSYRTKLISHRPYSSPVHPIIKKQFQKQTEENMEAWDLEIQNPVSTNENLTLTPSKEEPWKVLFTKTSSPSSQTLSQSDTTTTHSSPVSSKYILEAVTPTSTKKRKKSVVSPKNLIDRYLIPSKRKKLDTVNEI